MIRVNEQEGMKPIQMSICEAPAHCCNIDEEEGRDDHLWYHDILRYVKNQKYPDQATEIDRRTLRRLANGYVLDGEILYKKRKDQVLLRCVDAVEARKILEEVHEGVCGTHANGRLHPLRQKVPQVPDYGDKIYVPPSPLHVMTSPWPFSMWGMNVIGPISPKASNGHRFIFVVIDYFTKWVEAVSYANVTKTVVSKFLKREIICRYGKMTKTYRDWHEKLPLALYAYQTSVRTSTGATPFLLLYGMEAVLPIEVEIPSLWVLSELKLNEAKWVQSRYDQLNLIEEKRLGAIRHGQMYQKRMMRLTTKKFTPEFFMKETWYRKGSSLCKRISEGSGCLIGKDLTS
ncbi:RNA-directed DNA polymerase [Gossypium australe]|uniref:RNA-directed DNA polymerase n=1 Tax=Gossypium australe TaxID=47621 RepID=A0A5B6V9A0_9ROSI|nr:RNA-directed DNA polymerase [Gossypium australe]